MPAKKAVKKQSMITIKLPVQAGGNAVDDFMNFLSGANTAAKKSKVISKALASFPHPTAQALSGFASQMGYAQKRRYVKRS